MSAAYSQVWRAVTDAIAALPAEAPRVAEAYLWPKDPNFPAYEPVRFTDDRMSVVIGVLTRLLDARVADGWPPGVLGSQAAGGAPLDMTDGTIGSATVAAAILGALDRWEDRD